MTSLRRRSVLTGIAAACLGCEPSSRTSRPNKRSAPEEEPSGATLTSGSPGRPNEAGTVELPTRWRPDKTRAFIVCLSQFEGDTAPTWPADERNDPAFAELLRKRGVPRDRLVHLMDSAATTRGIRSGLDTLVRGSAPDEELLVYVGTHGSYDATRNTHGFSSFDGHMDIRVVFDAIEKGFAGARVMLFGDTCYAGGFVEEAVKRSRASQVFAALSSTGAQQVGWSGWRFVDVLLRAFDGNAVVDGDADGVISFADLGSYAAKHLVFSAEGMPIFTAPRGLTIGEAKKRGDARVGERLEVEWRGHFYKAEIIDVRDGELRIHYTNNSKTDDDEWVTLDRTRPFRPTRHAVGTAVEIQASGKTWYPGVVKEHFESLHLCGYDGWAESYDEWFGPSRIRAARGATPINSAPPTDTLPK